MSDSEAFDNWFESLFPDNNYANLRREAWLAACEYKQKEINDIRLEYDKLTDWASEYKEAARSEAQLVNELQAEVSELKQKISTIWAEAEKFYLDD